MEKRKNNILDRIINLTTFNKTLVIGLYLLLSFAFVFIISNFYNIKNNIYDNKSIIENSSVDTLDGFNIYTINIDPTKTKRLFVKYESDKIFDMQLKYSMINNEVIEYEKEDLNKVSSIIEYNVYDVKNTINNIIITVPENAQIKDVIINNKITYNYSLFSIFIIILIIFISLLYVYKNGKDKIHIIFFTIFACFGLYLVIFSPVATGGSWDDQIHFRNTIQSVKFDTYNLSEAEDIVIKVDQPFHLFDTQEEQSQLYYKMNELDKNKNGAYPGIVSYTYLAYLPGGIVYTSLKKIGIPFSFRYKLMKVLKVLFVALLIAYAIKIIPKYKLLVFVIGLTPMGLFLTANYSYDEWIISFSILAFAYFIKMMNSEKVDSKDAIKYILLVSFSTLIKVIYGPLLLLLLLIPNNKFKSYKTAKVFKLFLLLLSFVVMTTFIVPTLFSNLGMDDSRGGDNVSLVGQVSWILHNPIMFTKIFVKEVIANAPDRILSYNGIFYWAYYSANGGHLSYMLFLGCLIISYIYSCSENNNINKYQRYFIFVMIFLIICITFGTLYLTFNNIGSTFIGGVQSRYFLPVLIFIIYGLITNKIRIDITLFDACKIITVLYLIIYVYQIAYTYMTYL